MTELDTTNKMRFFEYRQNNSGDSFAINEDLAVNMIFEAPNAKTANALAENFGLYFGGVRSGQDCGCCGDRWSSQWSDDKGSEVPTMDYGTLPLDSITAANFGDGADSWGKPDRWTPDDLPFAIVVYLNGEVRRYRKSDYAVIKAEATVGKQVREIEGGGPKEIEA